MELAVMGTIATLANLLDVDREGAPLTPSPKPFVHKSPA
jgi:hypothetical protein